MSITLDALVTLYQLRRREQGPLIDKMRLIRDAYQGDLVVPLPELDSNEKPAVANLIARGIDALAMRIASTSPNVSYLPLSPGQRKSEELARKRMRVSTAWLDQNRYGLHQRRRARHIIGYSIAPVKIQPGSEGGPPVWHVRDPLTTYMPPRDGLDDPTMVDCIFTYQRTLQWLNIHYPGQIRGLWVGKDAKPDDRFTILEYSDANESVLAVIGKTRSVMETEPNFYGSPYAELERTPNRAGICPVVVPGRITLDRLQGMFDGSIGMYQMRARLNALSVIATQRGVMPEEWLVARPGEVAEIVQTPNPITGQIGVVKGGEIREVQVNPQFAAAPMLAALERDERVEGAIPAEFGGESQSNVRTGRRGDAIISAAVDPTVQEIQEIFEVSLEAELKVAIAMDKAYGGNQTKAFYFYKGNTPGASSYVPNALWENDRPFVRYAHAGTDINGLVISGGQRVGLGTLSKLSFMEIDPLVEDPIFEHDRVVAEALESAELASIQQGVQSGQMAVGDLARIHEIVLTDRAPLFEAVLQAQSEAQARQAQQVPPGSPETQSGLAPPGAGAESAAAIPPPSPSVQNLSMLLSNLHRPQVVGNQLAAAGQ